MPKPGLIFIILITTLFGACKKDVLHWQKVQKLNSNTSARLNHVRFINDTICIASGGVQFSQSQIVRSTDGGYTWSAYSSPDAPLEMMGMDLSSNGTIYLSGLYGDILHSIDLGSTWQYNRITNYEQYVGGTFPVPDTGIFVSTVLQRQCAITRVDANFNIIDEQTFLFGLNNIYMTGPNTGYIIGYGTVMKTSNRATTWNFQDVKGDNFTSMDIHGDEIWMCGFNGSIFHTIDGGAHWDRLRNGNDISLPRYNLMSIVFKDPQNGWATTDNGKVIYTDDGGKHWAEYDQFTTSSLRNIIICPNGDLLVAGDNGSLYRIVPKPY
jgi:photosystem II stability/assembly factor-like uncharacterized protein